MFRAAILAVLCMATPALSQVVIIENGIQIAEPTAGFSLYESDEFFKARHWVHDTIGLYSITIMDKQDPENTYTGMDWDERLWDPIVVQSAHISAQYQGANWIIAEGEISGNGFYQRSIIKDGCPVIATLIVAFPEEARPQAQVVFTRLAESLTIVPSPLCP